MCTSVAWIMAFLKTFLSDCIRAWLAARELRLCDWSVQLREVTRALNAARANVPQ
mgnify:CR=1